MERQTGISKSINISGIGYRHVEEEREQIMWYLEQRAKALQKNKALVTRYWLNVKENFTPTLLKLEAYELLAFINSKTTKAQEKRRIAARTKAKLKADLEYANFKRKYEREKVKRFLIASINYN